MTTITFEVPDELAAQFKVVPSALPALIREAVASKMARISPQKNGDESATPIYQEIIDLMISAPSAGQVLAFKISEAAQKRLEELLDKNREEELTAEERAELNTYLRLSQYVTKLKIRASTGQSLLG